MDYDGRMLAKRFGLCQDNLGYSSAGSKGPHQEFPYTKSDKISGFPPIFVVHGPPTCETKRRRYYDAIQYQVMLAIEDVP